MRIKTTMKLDKCSITCEEILNCAKRNIKYGLVNELPDDLIKEEFFTNEPYNLHTQLSLDLYVTKYSEYRKELKKEAQLMLVHILEDMVKE